MRKQMVGSWQMSGLNVPLQFAAFADAYLDSASHLCKSLKRSLKKSSYPRGAVVLFLTFHAVEFFLKAAILQKSPNEGLHHNIEHLEKRYRILYPGKKYVLNIPFKTEYIGFEPPKIATRKTSFPPQDQVLRYPSDKKGREWNGVFAFDPILFLPVIDRLQADFKRLQPEIFSTNEELEEHSKTCRTSELQRRASNK